MAAERIGDWIQVYTGGRFYPLDPRLEEIHIEDIAHALAHQCRFSGHVREFWSVAQHSTLVSHHCDPTHALWGLLHDAAEAYLVDLPRPVKQSLRAAGITVFDALEQQIMEAVCARFGLTMPQPQSVDTADVLLLVTEARDLMAPLAPGWQHTEANGFRALPERLIPVGPAEAEAMFLERFEELTHTERRVR